MNSKLAWLSTSGSIHLLHGIVLAAVVAAGTAVPVYAQASWSGQIQCQLNIQSAGYAHQEVQTWKLTEEPPTLNGAMPMYSANWSATGQGATQKSLPTQALAGEWKTSTPPTKVIFVIIKRASDQRLLVKRYTPAVSVPAAVVGVRKVALPGAAASASPIQLPAWEWPLPVIEDAGTSTDVSGSATTMIAATSTPMQPGGTSSPANCVWHFTYGTSTPSRTTVAPTVTANTPGLSTTQPTTNTGTSQTPATPPTGVDAAKDRVPVAEKAAPPPPKPLLTVTAATSPCNTAGSFDISSDFREFLAGATTVDFGSDITVTGVTVDSDAKITTQLLIPSSATPGPHTVTVKIGAKTVTAPAAFTVTNPCASSQSDLSATVDPSFGWENQQNLTLHASSGQAFTLGNGQGFIQGITTADFGPGITVNSLNVTSAHKADVNITISSTAARGSRSVTLKTANQIARAQFEVMSAGSTALTLPTATTPCNVVGSFIVKGSATHFASGISQANFGPDITVLAITVQNPNQLTAQIYVPATANPGADTVTVTTGGETASLASGFAVTAPCAATQESSDRSGLPSPTPGVGVRGAQNMNVGLAGVNLVQGVTVADFGNGITLNSLTVTATNYARANISISPTALVGTHNVTLTTANYVAANKFTVTGGGNTALTMPTATAACNQVGSFQIYGNNANFASGVTVVDFGPDITVLDVTVSKSTSLTARVYIPRNATAGAHTITATTGAEVASLASGFTVTNPCAAQQRADGVVLPDIGVVGMQNLVVHVSGANANMLQGITTADFGPGITVNSVTVTGATSADVNISISPTANQGARDITVTTPTVVLKVWNPSGQPFYVER